MKIPALFLISLFVSSVVHAEHIPVGHLRVGKLLETSVVGHSYSQSGDGKNASQFVLTKAIPAGSETTLSDHCSLVSPKALSLKSNDALSLFYLEYASVSLGIPAGAVSDVMEFQLVEPEHPEAVVVIRCDSIADHDSLTKLSKFLNNTFTIKP